MTVAMRVSGDISRRMCVDVQFLTRARSDMSVLSGMYVFLRVTVIVGVVMSMFMRMIVRMAVVVNITAVMMVTVVVIVVMVMVVMTLDRAQTPQPLIKQHRADSDDRKSGNRPEHWDDFFGYHILREQQSG